MNTLIRVIGTIVIVGIGWAGLSLIHGLGLAASEDGGRVWRVLSTVFFLALGSVVCLFVLAAIVSLWRGAELP
jgi:hypothetical protein